MHLNITGLKTVCTCTGAACDTPPNACGVHIHEGTTCETAGGHYYGNGVTVDPWTGANGAFYNNAEPNVAT